MFTYFYSPFRRASTCLWSVSGGALNSGLQASATLLRLELIVAVEERDGDGSCLALEVEWKREKRKGKEITATRMEW